MAACRSIGEEGDHQASVAPVGWLAMDRFLPNNTREPKSLCRPPKLVRLDLLGTTDHADHAALNFGSRMTDTARFKTGVESQ